MEINNVKIDWESVLEPYISHLEKEFPGLDIRGKMSTIISDLANNRIKSRIIMGAGRVCAYAFYTPAGFYSDRIYGNAGFYSEGVYTSERLGNLMAWLAGEASSGRKMLMIDRIFNMPSGGEEILSRMGFRLLQRIRMERDLGIPVPDKKPAGNLTFSGLEKFDVNTFSDAEYEAFSSVEDSVLMGSSAEERHNFTRFIFSGSELYGEINSTSSLFCFSGSELAGAVVVANQKDGTSGIVPLVLTVFVRDRYRRRGIGRYLLLHSLGELRKQGFRSVRLYVNATSEARHLYSSLGFVESDERYSEELHYLPSGINGH